MIALSLFVDIAKLAVIRGESDTMELAKKLVGSESERERAVKELEALRRAQKSIRKLVLENAGSFPVKAHCYVASIYTEEMANVVRRHATSKVDVKAGREGRPIPTEKMGLIDGEDRCP